MSVSNEICIPLDADHVHMTKFDDSTNDVYQLIVGLIREVRDNEPKKVAKAGKTGVFQPCDNMVLKLLGLIKDREQRTVGSKGM